MEVHFTDAIRSPELLTRLVKSGDRIQKFPEKFFRSLQLAPKRLRGRTASGKEKRVPTATMLAYLTTRCERGIRETVFSNAAIQGDQHRTR
jgi:hypothetical protein